MSPILNFITFLPTKLIYPTISCPGQEGYITSPHNPLACIQSEWHNPVYWILIRTSSSPISGNLKGNCLTVDYLSANA